MSIKAILSAVKDTRLLSIDPSSHSLAWVVLDASMSSIKIVASGKIEYKKDKEISSKFSKIDSGLKEIVAMYSPKHAVIEQSIYVQNFQTSRVISYIIGYSWGVLSQSDCIVEDVNPLTWKSGIGYKNLTKKDVAEISARGTGTNAQTKLKDERKKRVRDIVRFLFAEGDINLDDDDIIDAAGIGLWFVKKKIQGVGNGE
jgi:Holliday junction resolvasome RuvABC endonuclease subunit